MTRRSQHYPPELRERAVRMVAEVTTNYDSQWAAINAVAQKLGVGTAETVRKWVRQAEIEPSRVRCQLHTGGGSGVWGSRTRAGR
jgi:transposase